MFGFKEQIRFVKAKEQQSHWIKDMLALYNIIQVESDEGKRETAWAQLQALKSKAVKHAVRENIGISLPVEISW